MMTTKQRSLDLQGVGKNFKALMLAALLYPLQRIQNIQQVQTTYASPTLKNTTEIVAQAIHYGRRSYFRGLATFATRAALLTATIRGTDLIVSDSEDGMASGLLSAGIAATSYLLFYPIEIINLRMSVEVQRQRFYSNFRSCASKIKVNQGLKTFYRGFGYSCLLFTGQIGLIKYARRRLEESKDGYSEWQLIGGLLGIVVASEVLLYPFNTVKKLYQVNGGLGHTDQNVSLLRTWRSNLRSLFKGLPTKMANLSAYTLLYCWWVADEQPAQ